jgi:hypothetical protein
MLWCFATRNKFPRYQILISSPCDCSRVLTSYGIEKKVSVNQSQEFPTPVSLIQCYYCSILSWRKVTWVACMEVILALSDLQIIALTCMQRLSPIWNRVAFKIMCGKNFHEHWTPGSIADLQFKIFRWLAISFIELEAYPFLWHQWKCTDWSIL